MFFARGIIATFRVLRACGQYLRLAGECVARGRARFEAGFAIALDDFGTGYASLNYLRKLPLTRVKIDKEFVRVSVETPEQLAFLKTVGCGAAQGCLISRPVDEADVGGLPAAEVQRVMAA